MMTTGSLLSELQKHCHQVLLGCDCGSNVRTHMNEMLVQNEVEKNILMDVRRRFECERDSVEKHCF